MRCGLGQVGHPQSVDVAAFEPTPTGPVHPPRDDVQDVAEPLGDGARLVQGDSRPGDDHRAPCTGEVPRDLLDLVEFHVATRGELVEIGVGDQRAQVGHPGGEVPAISGVLEALVEDHLDHRQQQRPVLTGSHREVYVGLLGALGADRVDHDDRRAALLPVQCPPPTTRHGLQPIPGADRRIGPDQKEVVAVVDVGHRRHEL